MLGDRNYLYIGGEWVAPASKARIRVLNAATEEPIGDVPEAAVADVDRAVAAARHAFASGWSRTLPAERAAFLNRFADALEKRAADIAYAVSSQNGMLLLGLSDSWKGVCCWDGSLYQQIKSIYLAG